MPTRGLINPELLTDIADAIRAKNGTSAGMTPAQMAEAISALELSDAIKQALLNCFAHVAWIDDQGQTYYDALEAALYPLDHITAVYTQSGTVYDTDSLDSLKADLVVTAVYEGGNTETIPAANYTLSGTLTAGTSTITVSYGGKTATFDVEVSYRYVYRYSQGELVKVQGGIGVSKRVGGDAIDQSGSLVNNRRVFAVLSGVIPFDITQDQTTYVPSQYYPVRVPSDATGVKVTVTPNTGYVAINLGTNGDDRLVRSVSGAWTLKEDSKSFEAGSVEWLSIACKANSSGTDYTTSTEPTELVVQFSK